LVEHIDDAAIADVERIYRERLPAGGRVLDCMSSWVSHLPPDVAYERVVGLGMNAAELSRNSRLAAYVVHDLNRDPHLPFEDDSFDAAVICVSVQYLTRPVEVLRDLARVVRAGGPVVITFSNRCFPTKAVAVWRSLSDRDHLRLVESYLVDAGWVEIESLASPPRRGDPLYAVIGISPSSSRA
jgi:SAM-dependent methyltransferase